MRLNPRVRPDFLKQTGVCHLQRTDCRRRITTVMSLFKPTAQLQSERVLEYRFQTTLAYWTRLLKPVDIC